jgi:hypothetical protein
MLQVGMLILVQINGTWVRARVKNRNRRGVTFILEDGGTGTCTSNHQVMRLERGHIFLCWSNS